MKQNIHVTTWYMYKYPITNSMPLTMLTQDAVGAQFFITMVCYLHWVPSINNQMKYFRYEHNFNQSHFVTLCIFLESIKLNILKHTIAVGMRTSVFINSEMRVNFAVKNVLKSLTRSPSFDLALTSVSHNPLLSSAS